MLKTIKIPTIAPTCFGSRRNHHQGAISCLAKTTIMILLCLSLMMWSMLWRHTSLLCKRAVYDFIIVCISWNNKQCSWYYWCTVQTRRNFMPVYKTWI